MSGPLAAAAIPRPDSPGQAGRVLGLSGSRTRVVCGVAVRAWSLGQEIECHVTRHPPGTSVTAYEVTVACPLQARQGALDGSLAGAPLKGLLSGAASITWLPVYWRLCPPRARVTTLDLR